MLFEVSLRSVILLPVLALIAGCDRPSPSNGQASAAIANASAPDEVNSTAPDEVTGGVDNGVDAIGRLDRSHKGESAPGVEFDGPDGAKLGFAKFTGKPYLLNLWATWCGPCKVEMPTLEKVAARGRLTVLTISQDLDGAAKVTPYFAAQKFKALKAFTDPKMDVSVALGGPSLPTTILYDATGHEMWRMTGGMDWTSPTAKDLLAEAR
jgi:thiol-disulfide isomerase/thioredoxin